MQRGFLRVFFFFVFAHHKKPWWWLGLSSTTKAWTLIAGSSMTSADPPPLIWTQILQSDPRNLPPLPKHVNSLIQNLNTWPQVLPMTRAPNPTPDTTATSEAVLTPEEVLLTWCHCAEKAVRCHSCLWLQQAPLLFLCGFRDPWHVLNQEHAACHEEKKWKSHPQDMLLRINYLDDHK